jgi:Cu2+-containing amine oxidase
MRSFLLVALHSLFATTLHAHPNDPLSAAEINKALSLAQSSTKIKAARSAVSKNAVKQAKELLLIERHQQKNAPKGQRLADIFTYDYETDELIESRVDLNTNEVISTSRKQYVQLPLTENEVNRAKQIIFEDEDERRILENEYQRITSRPFTTTDELNIKAFTFTKDSLPNRVNEASKLCGLHRCAQMMLYTGENIVFEVSPIVNLSKGVVTQRIGF